jgi:hypothetical protein
MHFKYPNFLLVGVPKAGTTSLYHYLSEHPEIFLSSVKEPKFFSYISGIRSYNGPGDSEGERDVIKTSDAYINLFSKTNNSKAIGECSVDNLYYHDLVIPKIKEYLGDEVKIVIVLRNPIERAYSSFLYLLRDGRENLSFEDALDAEDKRIKANWEFMWHYKNAGLYFNQVKSYIENFKNVKIFLFDDLKENPVFLMKDLLSFLGVDSGFFPGDLDTRYNKSGIPRIRSLYNFLNKPNFFKSYIKIFFPKTFRIKLKNKFMNKLLIKPDMMKESTRESLKQFYKEDIIKLQKLIDKDLSGWLR